MLYIYSNDGSTLLSSAEATSFKVTKDGITIINGSSYTVYTYSGSYIFCGASSSVSGTTVNYAIDNTYSVSGNLSIYIIDKGLQKVVVSGNTKLDLSSDTISASDVVSGVTFHGADGKVKTGTVQVYDGTVE